MLDGSGVTPCVPAEPWEPVAPGSCATLGSRLAVEAGSPGPPGTKKTA